LYGNIVVDWDYPQEFLWSMTFDTSRERWTCWCCRQKFV